MRKLKSVKQNFKKSVNRVSHDEGCGRSGHTEEMNTDRTKPKVKPANDMCKKIKAGPDKREGKPWFDSECRSLKKDARHALTKVRLAENKRNQQFKATRLADYNEKRSLYHKALNKKQIEFKKCLYDKLVANLVIARVSEL